MVGRMIPTGKIGTYIGMRHFLGGVVAFVLGLVCIHPLLNALPLPTNYLLVISIGVASFPDDGQKLLELIAAADRALYRAKDAGRNCVST